MQRNFWWSRRCLGPLNWLVTKQVPFGNHWLIKCYEIFKFELRITGICGGEKSGWRFFWCSVFVSLSDSHLSPRFVPDWGWIETISWTVQIRNQRGFWRPKYFDLLKSQRTWCGNWMWLRSAQLKEVRGIPHTTSKTADVSLIIRWTSCSSHRLKNARV